MRTTLLLAALMWAGSAQAAPSGDEPRLAQASKPATKPAADDEEDEPAKPAATPVAPPAALPTPIAPAPNEQMQLVSGAPLADPNVAVHIVEKKEFADGNRSELVLYPIAVQVNGKFTQTVGSMLSYVYHLQENFGLQLTGGYNWINTEAAFNAELVEKVRSEAQAATSLLWVWGVLGGVEVTPLYAKFAFFDGALGHFSIVINGGAGVGGTRHQLKPANTKQDGTASPATFGDTGLRFMGGIGAGFRLLLGERFAFRLELRDVVYTARADQVNGCNGTDLRAMDAKVSANLDPASATVSSGCQTDKFTGTDASGYMRKLDVRQALNLVKSPTSDVLNNLGLYLGVSFIF
jgi:outer membrane beta-barrel protein